MADLAIVDGVIEGPSGEPLMSEAGDVDRVIEACYSNRIRLVLLYAENLPDRFFDLSSGQAGAILQKLRNYRMRLAVVARGRAAQRPLPRPEDRGAQGPLVRRVRHARGCARVAPRQLIPVRLERRPRLAVAHVRVEPGAPAAAHL